MKNLLYLLFLLPVLVQAQVKAPTQADLTKLRQQKDSLKAATNSQYNFLNNGKADIAAAKQFARDSAAAAIAKAGIAPENLDKSRFITAPTTVTIYDRVLVITAGTFTQPIPSGMHFHALNRGSGTISFTYNGVIIKKLIPGTPNSPDHIYFNFSTDSNDYLTY